MAGRIRDNGKAIEWTDMENFTIQMAKQPMKDIGYKTNSTAQAEYTTKFQRTKCQARTSTTWTSTTSTTTGCIFRVNSKATSETARE